MRADLSLRGCKVLIWVGEGRGEQFNAGNMPKWGGGRGGSKEYCLCEHFLFLLFNNSSGDSRGRVMVVWRDSVFFGSILFCLYDILLSVFSPSTKKREFIALRIWRIIECIVTGNSLDGKLYSKSVRLSFSKWYLLVPSFCLVWDQSQSCKAFARVQPGFWHYRHSNGSK